MLSNQKFLKQKFFEKTSLADCAIFKQFSLEKNLFCNIWKNKGSFNHFKLMTDSWEKFVIEEKNKQLFQYKLTLWNNIAKKNLTNLFLSCLQYFWAQNLCALLGLLLSVEDTVYVTLLFSLLSYFRLWWNSIATYTVSSTPIKSRYLEVNRKGYSKFK